MSASKEAVNFSISNKALYSLPTASLASLENQEVSGEQQECDSDSNFHSPCGLSPSFLWFHVWYSWTVYTLIAMLPGLLFLRRCLKFWLKFPHYQRPDEENESAAGQLDLRWFILGSCEITDKKNDKMYWQKNKWSIKCYSILTLHNIYQMYAINYRKMAIFKKKLIK